MDNVLLIDYLTISSKIDNEWSLIRLFGLEGCTWEKGKACNGYREALWYESIKVLYDASQDDMGVCIELSGQGCRTFETYGHGDYGFIFDTIFNEPDDYNISRLDIAFDDRTGIFDFDRLADDTHKGNYTSRSNTWSVTLGNKERIIYHGSKKSDVLIRIYDKALERNKQSEGHWIRFELQLRREKALNFAKMYGRFHETFYDVVYTYLRYIVHDDLTTITRCSMTDYWREFLGAAKLTTLSSDLGVDYNLARLDNFVMRQAGNAVETYIAITGKDAFFRNLKERGTAMNEKYKRLLERYGEYDARHNDGN